VTDNYQTTEEHETGVFV